MDIVITGVGVISPIGIGRDEFLQSLIQKKSGVKRRETLDAMNWPFGIAAAVEDFEPKKYIKNRKRLKVMCREIQFGCAAAQLAIDDSQLEVTGYDHERIGVITGSENFYCPPEAIKDVYIRYFKSQTQNLGTWVEAALREIEPLWMLKHLPNMVSSQIGIALDARGPSNAIVQNDVSGLLAVIEAIEVIRRGTADIMIAGGTGARMNLVGMVYRGVDGMASSNGEPPESACKPFDKNRTGMVAGEGAGMIALETREHAESRGAKILGHVRGVASTCKTNVSDFEDTIFRAANVAISKGDLTPDQISHVDACGFANKHDVTESRAIERLFGNEKPVSALKSYFGNLGAGSGTVEMIGSLLALREKKVLATLNSTELDSHCPVNLVAGDHLSDVPQSTFLKLGLSPSGQAAAIAVSV